VVDQADSRAKLAPVLEIALEGRCFRFDEAVYAAAAPAERRAPEVSLDQVLARLCLRGSIPEVLQAAPSIAEGDYALRHRAALRLI